MPTEFHPIPNDPDAPIVREFISIDKSWVMCQVGEIISAAVLGVNSETGEYQPIVLVEADGRINKTDESARVRFALSPEAAVALRDDLIHTIAFFDQAPDGPETFRGKLDI